MDSNQRQKLTSKKTSTPEKDANSTLQCDLSMILPLDLTTSSTGSTAPGISSAVGSTASGTLSAVGSSAPGTVVNGSTIGSALSHPPSKSSRAIRSQTKQMAASKREETFNEEEMANAISSANLRSQLMNFLVEKSIHQMQTELDEDMDRLQKETEREVARGKELKSRLETIKTNTEIEKLLDAHEKTIGGLHDNLKAENLGGNLISICDATTKGLERDEGRLPCTNIIIPETDESNEKLQSAIIESKKAHEELASQLAKQQIDEKMVEALDKTLKSTEEFAQRQRKFEEDLKELQTLNARENTLRVMAALE